jgi:H+/Cl- antiporter ClcA
MCLTNCGYIPIYKTWLYDYEIFYIILGILLGLLGVFLYNMLGDSLRWIKNKRGKKNPLNPFYILEVKINEANRSIKEIKDILDKK